MYSAPGPPQNYFFRIQLQIIKSLILVLKSCLKVEEIIFFTLNTVYLLYQNHIFLHVGQK